MNKTSELLNTKALVPDGKNPFAKDRAGCLLSSGDIVRKEELVALPDLFSCDTTYVLYKTPTKKAMFYAREIRYLNTDTPARDLRRFARGQGGVGK